jgi:hypothetical protein
MSLGPKANWAKGWFDSRELEIMERAFDCAWATLQAHNVMADCERDEELRAELGEKMIALAKIHGISDAETLRGQLLNALPLQGYSSSP